MYIFNPEHDLCLANGDIHFVPPQSAMDFGRDCASLTHFMEGLDDMADIDTPTPKKIVPWGWNSVLRDRLLKEGYDQSLMPTDRQLSTIRELSHREMALKALEYINVQLLSHKTDANTPANPVTENIVTDADYRIAAKSIGEVNQFLKEKRNVVLKAPLSGSGKGIRFVSEALSHSDEGWCRNLIKRHGSVIVEKRFNPVLEFAMLFKCTGGNSLSNSAITENRSVEFIGYSLFYTQNGMYKGNILASDEWIEKEITKYVPHQILELVKRLLKDFLMENIACSYEGFAGIDQFVHLPFEEHSGQQYSYNPAVEINLRMTMGLLAHNIYNRFRKDLKLQDGSHYFEIIRGKKGSGTNYSYAIAHMANLHQGQYCPTESPL